jgi:nitroreductase
MDTLAAIHQRRSIRQYTAEPVADATIELLLRAAMAAPSAGNEQPWHFVVIKDRKTLAAIPSFHPHAGMLKEAPVAILVGGDVTLERHKGMWVQDCSAAVENLLVAAADQGLGAVWLGVFPREERVAGLRKLLGLPKDIIPLALIAIGHPGESKAKEDRFRQDRVHHDKW